MRRRNSVISCIVVVALLLGICFSEAATVTLTWDPPTTNADGTPLTDLAGYRVYWGAGPRTYTQQQGQGLDVGNIVTYQVTGLGEQRWYFAVTAYDTAGNESAYSNEVSKSVTIQPSPPSLTGAEVSVQITVR